MVGTQETRRTRRSFFATTWLGLSLLLLSSCAKEDALPPHQPASSTGALKSASPWLVLGNTSCYYIMNDCIWESPTCGSSGKLNFTTPCSSGYVCAGGISMLKGTGSSFGPWYIIQPKSQPAGYKCLRVRFKAGYTNDLVGSYSTVTKRWTVFTGTNFEAVQQNPPTPC